MKHLIPFLAGRYINAMSAIFPAHAASFGFRMFCYPFRAPLKPHQLEFFGTAEQSTLTHQGIEIKVYRWNNGPRKILFLHGWQSHSFRWKNYLKQFPADEYTLYALDAPGHGLSKGSFLTVPLYSEVIEKFIREKGVVFDTVISHSLGAFTVLYTLHRLPLLPVSKLVLLAPPGEATQFVSFYRDALKLSERSIRMITEYFESVIEKPVDYFSAPKFAASIKLPGLIIHDKDDDETAYTHSVAINKAWPGSSLVLTEGLNHNLKTPEVIQRVGAFARSDARHAAAVVSSDQ